MGPGDHAYHIAEDYRVQAQKAFLDTLNSTTFPAGEPFDTSAMTPPWHTDTPYEPAHHHDDDHHDDHHHDDRHDDHHHAAVPTTIPADAATSHGPGQRPSHGVGTPEQAARAQQDAHRPGRVHETLEVAHRDGSAVDTARHAGLHTWIEKTAAEVDHLHHRIGVLEGLGRQDGSGHTVLPSRVEHEIDRLHAQIADDQAKIAAWHHELHPDQHALAVMFDDAATPVTESRTLPAAS